MVAQEKKFFFYIKMHTGKVKRGKSIDGQKKVNLFTVVTASRQIFLWAYCEKLGKDVG